MPRLRHTEVSSIQIFVASCEEAANETARPSKAVRGLGMRSARLGVPISDFQQVDRAMRCKRFRLHQTLE